MKHIVIFLLSFSSISYSQLTLDVAKDSLQKYYLGSYSYHEQFLGHAGYGAPRILTADGGAAAFGSWEDELGSCGLLVKLDKSGNEEWKRIVRYTSDEMSDTEPQSVVQDKKGNYFVFMLMYKNDEGEYNGGSECVQCYDKTGKLLWELMLGGFTQMNNPIISYISALDDGRIYLRGHVVTEEQIEGQDPVYHFWEGWIDSKGVLTQKVGDVINWEDQTWQDLYKPE